MGDLRLRQNLKFRAKRLRFESQAVTHFLWHILGFRVSLWRVALRAHPSLGVGIL